VVDEVPCYEDVLGWKYSSTLDGGVADCYQL